MFDPEEAMSGFGSGSWESSSDRLTITVGGLIGGSSYSITVPESEGIKLPVAGLLEDDPRLLIGVTIDGEVVGLSPVWSSPQVDPVPPKKTIVSSAVASSSPATDGASAVVFPASTFDAEHLCISACMNSLHACMHSTCAP
jgi:hypothetical protein